MDDFLRISRHFNFAGAELLLTDLDVAMTFMDVAATTHDPETVRRNYDNAHQAYAAVIGFMPRLQLTATERTAIEGKLMR